MVQTLGNRKDLISRLEIEQPGQVGDVFPGLLGSGSQPSASGEVPCG